MAKFSFIIVTYNSSDTIEACLESIVSRTADAHEILVVDNSPNDLTSAVVRWFIASRPAVVIRLIEPHENLGFAKACNLGAREASGEFLFFLNPDTELMNDAGAILARCFQEQPRCVAVGPAIFDRAESVTKTCRNLPTITRVFLDATGVDQWFGAYKLTRFRHNRPRQVEQIIGAAILIRRSDFERLGGMDERFFIYFEEVDLCKRIKDAGGEIWFWPDAQVQHLAGQSCEDGAVRARMIYVLRNSRKKYFAKHFGLFGGAAMEVVNRIEGLQKSLVLALLWVLRRKNSDREKASGFWAVATGASPRS